MPFMPLMPPSIFHFHGKNLGKNQCKNTLENGECPKNEEWIEMTSDGLNF